jgi:hypothetical protein
LVNQQVEGERFGDKGDEQYRKILKEAESGRWTTKIVTCGLQCLPVRWSEEEECTGAHTNSGFQTI